MQNYDYIGKYVKKFESGAEGSLALSSCGNDWGLSCGTYQLTLRWGNCIKFLKQYFPTQAANLYYNGPDKTSKSWPGPSYCSSPDEVKTIWLECLSLVGEEEFFNHEHAYMRSNYYEPIRTKILPLGLDLNNASRAFQECFWSWAINRGVMGAYNEFVQALQSIPNIQAIAHGPLFKQIYETRYKNHPYPRFDVNSSSSEFAILWPFLVKHGIGNVQILSPSPLTTDTTNNNSVGGGKNMKYNSANKPLVCMMTDSTCYKGTREFTPLGVLWHSTGANNPYLKRYVQPSKSDPRYNELMQLLGDNKWNNSWNEITHYAGLNAWIGKLVDETITTVQTLPWNYRPWGCGSGPNGSCNDAWIQFEICEDDLGDANYFNQVYEEAVQLTAYLCKMYNIDPHGYVYVGANNELCPTILCHADSYKFGVGSNHADVYHWFNKYGKTMDNVRDDVAALLKGEAITQPEITIPDPAPIIPETPVIQPELEIAIPTDLEFTQKMNEYLADLAKYPIADYSKEACEWAEESGLIRGDQYGNFMPRKFMSREEVATVLYRFYNKFIQGG